MRHSDIPAVLCATHLLTHCWRVCAVRGTRHIIRPVSTIEGARCIKDWNTTALSDGNVDDRISSNEERRVMGRSYKDELAVVHVSGRFPMEASTELIERFPRCAGFLPMASVDIQRAQFMW